MSRDKTSAALFNLILQAMRDMNLLTPGDNKFSRGQAQVSHDSKLELLRRVSEEAGANSILSIGRKIASYQTMLTIAVLRRATNPIDAIKRWQRLEKMYHSRHRVVLLGKGENRLELRHVSLYGKPPGSLENLLIAGIVLSLLEVQGCSQITAAFSNGDLFVQAGELCLDHAEASADYSTWQFSWASRSIREDASPLIPPSFDGDMSSRVKTIFLTDPAYPWTVAKLSDHCGFSSRTLQRRLAGEGTSVQVLLREFRANSASEMLATVTATLTDIAFANGYSDHPHFAREFKRCIGMRPSSYQQLVKPVAGVPGAAP